MRKFFSLLKPAKIALAIFVVVCPVSHGEVTWDFESTDGVVAVSGKLTTAGELPIVAGQSYGLMSIDSLFVDDGGGPLDSNDGANWLNGVAPPFNEADPGSILWDGSVGTVDLSVSDALLAFDSEFQNAIRLVHPSSTLQTIAFADPVFQDLARFSPTSTTFMPLQSVDELVGDFNSDGTLDAADIDLLSLEVANSSLDSQFDLNSDGVVDGADRLVWINDLKNTYLGDSNLDGEFNSGDFVLVFSAAEYEDSTAKNSTWAEGDWDGNGDFDSSDFVSAFSSAGYEQGPRSAVSIPEPHACFVPCILFVLVSHRKKRRSARSVDR